MGQPLEQAVEQACDAAMSVDGQLRRWEARLLFMAGALPTAEGEVLEIGSYKGRSTVALTKGVLWSGQRRAVVCDPHAERYPPENKTAYEDFLATLAEHGISENVEHHRRPSAELAEDWDRPLRLLWVDGAHDYVDVKADADGYFPHLVPGAIVIFHDVGRGQHPGCTRVFMEDVLLSDAFGMCGMSGYAAWAHFVVNGGCQQYRGIKKKAYMFLAHNRVRQALDYPFRGITKLRYHRFRKGASSFEKWIRSHGGTPRSAPPGR